MQEEDQNLIQHLADKGDIPLAYFVANMEIADRCALALALIKIKGLECNEHAPDLGTQLIAQVLVKQNFPFGGNQPSASLGTLLSQLKAMHTVSLTEEEQQRLKDINDPTLLNRLKQQLLGQKQDPTKSFIIKVMKVAIRMKEKDFAQQQQLMNSVAKFSQSYASFPQTQESLELSEDALEKIRALPKLGEEFEKLAKDLGDVAKKQPPGSPKDLKFAGMANTLMDEVTEQLKQGALLDKLRKIKGEVEAMLQTAQTPKARSWLPVSARAVLRFVTPGTTQPAPAAESPKQNKLRTNR